MRLTTQQLESAEKLARRAAREFESRSIDRDGARVSVESIASRDHRVRPTHSGATEHDGCQPCRPRDACVERVFAAVDGRSARPCGRPARVADAQRVRGSGPAMAEVAYGTDWKSSTSA